MATDLSVGSVPAFYRELYDIVCPNQEHVDYDMFVKLLVKSSLPNQTLSQIWDIVDNKQGYLTRNGLYKALALVALAQQGKNVSDKLLETYSDSELPKPALGDIQTLKKLSLRLRREKMPNILGLCYQDICELDTIHVELVPEKKGIILKHVEYEVTSRRYKSTVLRRYNDFLAFQDTLLMKYPYRMIPLLPPKKMMGGNREFIEHRRRALRRFLSLVVRHPMLTNDAILKYFFTFKGSDMQHKMKEHFKGSPDEFMTNVNALKAKDLVPMDTQLQFSTSRDHIKVLTAAVTKLRDISERTVLRATGYASDMLQLGKQLSALSSDTTNISAWTSGNSETWTHFRQGFKSLAVEYTALADKAGEQAQKQEEGVMEILNTFLDLLLAYRDLCERHERGVLSDHQHALAKMKQYKKKKMSATITGPSEVETVEQLEHRILKQENEISNMENRNFFSLHCVQMETQLVHANLEMVYHALQCMAEQEGRAHRELSMVWDQIRPMVEGLLPNNNTTTSASASPQMSPQSPSIHNAGTKA